MNDEQIRHEIEVAFHYSWQEDEWVAAFDEIVTPLTAEEALWRPRPDIKCIWEIVLHMATHIDNMVARVETGEKVPKPSGDWPPLPPEPNDAAWQAAKSEFRHSANRMKGLLETAMLDVIQASPYGLGDLLCRLTHNGYHLGQITKLREWQGLD